MNWSDPYALPSYESRLKLLNLESLVERRKNADIVFIHQLCTESFDLPDLLEFVNVNTNRHRHSSRVNGGYFYLPFCTSNYSMFSPINRMYRTANECSSFNINNSKDTLKRSLRAK